MNRLLLTLFIMICIPNYGYAQGSWPTIPTGKYVISVSHTDGGSTLLVDSETGQSWVLQYGSDKNGHIVQYSWKPVVFENLKDNLVYIYPVQDDHFNKNLTPDIPCLDLCQKKGYSYSDCQKTCS